MTVGILVKYSVRILFDSFVLLLLFKGPILSGLNFKSIADLVLQVFFAL